MASHDARIEAAALWWAKFQDGEPVPEEIAAWLAWMEDGANAEAFRSINDLALRIRNTDVGSPALLRQFRMTPQRSRGTRRSFAIAASVVAAILGLWGASELSGTLVGSDIQVPHSTDSYTTANAGQREVRLPDGSLIVLGGASRIDVSFSNDDRSVRLATGEAYFEVERDPAGRPFVVDVGAATVRVLGTTFNVRKSRDRIAVTVSEGHVRVDRSLGMLDRAVAMAGLAPPASVQAAPNQQIVIDTQDPLLALAKADAKLATSWRSGRLEFVDEPLDVVVEDVNRYSPGLRVTADPQLRSITYTGTFVPEHLEAWLDALGDIFPVQVTREGNTVTVRPRPPSN